MQREKHRESTKAKESSSESCLSKPFHESHQTGIIEKQDIRKRGLAVLWRAADSSLLGLWDMNPMAWKPSLTNSLTAATSFQLSAGNCWKRINNHSTKMWSLTHKWPKPSRALDSLTFYGLLANLPLACCDEAITLKCQPSLRTLTAFCSSLSHVFSHLCQTCLLCRPKLIFIFILCCPCF